MVNPGFVPESQPQRQEGNGLAVAGMVLGIVALVLCWIPFLCQILALLGIIFGALGIGRANKIGKGKGMAIAGLVCGVVGGVLGTVLIVMAMKSFDDYVSKSKATEASLELNRIGRRAKMAYGEQSQFPIGSAPLTPAQACCGQPSNKCQSNPSDWQNPVWQALDFSIDEPSLYRYSYESKDGKTFVAKAVGDLDCDGQEATYELDGKIDEAGNPTVTLTKPPAGAY